MLVKKVRRDSDVEMVAPAKETKREAKLVTDKELLARFYGNDNLTNEDKFLRNYILNEGWKEGTKLSKDTEVVKFLKSAQTGATESLGKKKVDEEDEAREDEMDLYEQRYNFRFEDPNAATITSHARNAGAEESLRRPDETRKLARERQKERKEDLKKAKKEELQQLKHLKRQEILDKIKKAEALSQGNITGDKNLVERVQKELETEFIPELYDKTMSKMFSDKYYEQSDDDAKKAHKNKAIDVNLMRDASDVSGSDVDEDEYERMLAAPLKERVVERAN